MAFFEVEFRVIYSSRGSVARVTSRLYPVVMPMATISGLPPSPFWNRQESRKPKCATRPGLAEEGGGGVVFAATAGNLPCDKNTTLTYGHASKEFNLKFSETPRTIDLPAGWGKVKDPGQSSTAHKNSADTEPPSEVTDTSGIQGQATRSPPSSGPGNTWKPSPRSGPHTKQHGNQCDVNPRYRRDASSASL
jgi:hypothetical protein